MRFFSTLLLALRRLRRRPVRSFLLLQGTVWGVAVAIFPAAVLLGTRQAALTQGSEIGADRIAVAIDPTGAQEQVLELGDLDVVRSGLVEAGITFEALGAMRVRPNEVAVALPEAGLTSCGRPVPWMHVALLDSNDEPVPAGAAGEICTRGPLVMNGYKDLPDETAETLSGGWLHTGDVGRFDDDGYLYIVDRTKDMVITGGFNVFPREVEDVLSAHPAVAMVMVIGVPDDTWGEAVKAVVVLRAGSEPSDELTRGLQQLVKDAKGSQQSPKSIDYVADLPLTPVGKPDKKAVRSWYWTDTDRAVS